MDLDDVKTFVEVADAGGVAPGARRLGLSKSVVSRRITRLEEALGTQLLARTARGSTLTEAGATFREHATRVVTELAVAQDALSPEGELRGQLRIAAPLSFGIVALAPVLADLARQHPHLHIDTTYSDRFVDLVAEGVDCAIRLGQMQDSSLVARRIFAFRAQIVASPNYLAARGTPQHIDDLADHEVAMRRGETWPLMDGDTPVPVRPQGRFTADCGDAVLAAVLADVGLAALPDFLTHAHIAAGRLVPVMTRYTTRELGMYVLRPQSAYPSRKIRVLIDLLAGHFSETCPRPALSRSP